MYFHLKPSSKVIKPYSLVEKVFTSQGFKRKQKKDKLYFSLFIKDNVTRLTYELQIPFKVILQKEEPLCKISDVYIYSKSSLFKNHRIPIAIIHAAKEKTSEVLSYLITNDKNLVSDNHH